MIVIPIQFIIGLFLGLVGLVLLIIYHLFKWANKEIKKIRKLK